MAPQDRVTVGGRDYLITGYPMGEVAAWKLVFCNGEQLSKADFLALPELEREQLLQAVINYMDKIYGQGT